MNSHAYDDESLGGVATPSYIPDADSGDTSSTSSIKKATLQVGRRATAHPPAVCETHFMTADSNDELSEKGGTGAGAGAAAMVNPLVMTLITLSLCSAVFMVSLVSFLWLDFVNFFFFFEPDVEIS